MPTTYELPTFLGESSAPVELVSELDRYEMDGASVVLRCKTLVYKPVLQDYYGTTCETILEAPKPGGIASILLDFCSDDIVRIRYTRGAQSLPPRADKRPRRTSTLPSLQTLLGDDPSPMVVGTFGGKPMPHIVETESRITIQTKSLRLEVMREPFQIRIFDHQGRKLWETRAVDIEGLRRPEVQWNPNEQRWIFYHRYAYPLGSLDYGDRQRAFISLDLRHDEHIYGFGEGFGRMDKRETMQTLWNQEGFGNSSPASYKRIPFYMSTRGYGLFIHSANAIRCRVGDLDHTALSAIVDDTTSLDLYFIYGPTFKDILPRYTSITGAPALPPKWTFGLWMGRISYNRQQQVEEVAKKLREHRIPCDVIHIDTDWYRRDWECDLEFSPEKFPDPAAMTSRLRAQGFRVSLWQWPNMVITSSMFAEAHEGGYLGKRANGQPYLFSGFQPDAGFIDYSNPAAVEWIKAKFRKLFDLGISAIKVDFGEGAPPDARYHNGKSAAMHNLYPLLYGGAIFDVTEEMQGKGKAVIWARSAWAGSQRYPVHWSGDGVARYEDLAPVLRAMLSFGLSGFPFYSHDIGGFSGLPDGPLYVRWAQLGLFSSHARAHGTPPREPWEFGKEAERIFRQYAELRYRMMPYIYSEAVESVRASLPLARPLMLEYESDPTLYGIEDQYMFGRALMIAPVLDESNHRRLYLPQDIWFDYWGEKPIEGARWIDVEAPLELMPMYVRAGSVIAYAPLAQSTAAMTLDGLMLEFYGWTDAGEYLVHDEDRPDIRVQWRRIGIQLHIQVDGAPGAVEIVVFGYDGKRSQARMKGDGEVIVEAS
jgi:alpha-D-xyloside xylohydrolase